MPEEVNYQPVASDPERSCRKCKNFEPNADDENIGGCFGHGVSAEATCNFFEAKE